MSDYVIEYHEFDGGGVVLPVRVQLFECPICGFQVKETQMVSDLSMCGDCAYDEEHADWSALRQQIESRLEVVFVDHMDGVVPANQIAALRREERAKERSQRNSTGGRRRRKHGGRR